MQLKISIIVPFYNRLSLLEKTILSVIQQNCNDWELLLIDDGSEEDISELRNKYQSDKIQFLKRQGQKKGAPVCRNLGAKKAEGTHLLFLDSDDLLANWAIEERLAVIKQNHSADAYIFEGLEFDNNRPEAHRLRTLYKCNDPLHQFLSFQSVWQTSCMVWTPTFFKSINGWDVEAMSWQDGEIHIRALLQDPHITWGSDLPDVFIRKHEDTNRISNKNTIDKLANRYSTYERINAHLKESSGSFTLFRKNVESALFTEVEGMDKEQNKTFEEWVQKYLPEAKLKKKLLWYVRIYRIFGSSSFMKRVLYQMRKIGIPNRRMPHWSIRPTLSVEAVKALSLKVSGSKHLITEIRYLGSIVKDQL